MGILDMYSFSHKMSRSLAHLNFVSFRMFAHLNFVLFVFIVVFRSCLHMLNLVSIKFNVFYLFFS